MRLNLLQQTPDVWTLVRLSAVFGYYFLLDSLKGLWLPLGISLAIAFFSGAAIVIDSSYSLSPARKVTAVLLIPTGIYFLVVCICAPTAYGMMAYPENRVLMFAHFVMVSGIILYGLFLGFIFRDFFIQKSRWKEILLLGVIILCLYPLRSINMLWKDSQTARVRAQQWDQRHGVILDLTALGEDNLEVKVLDSFAQIAELGDDASFWVNKCAAQFYGVDSITAIEGLHE